MKRNEGKYTKVKELPKGAKLVKEYARENNIGESAVYNQYSRAIKAGTTPPFKIVIFFERNFIVS